MRSERWVRRQQERSVFCAREVCHTAGRARVPVRLCLCVSVLLACVFICMRMRVCGCLRVRDGWMTSDFLLCLGTLMIQPPDVAWVCPQIGEHHLQQLFGAMLLATKGPEMQGERDDLLVTLGMVTDSARPQPLVSVHMTLLRRKAVVCRLLPLFFVVQHRD
jgi:hypothetical protein